MELSIALFWRALLFFALATSLAGIRVPATEPVLITEVKEYLALAGDAGWTRIGKERKQGSEKDVRHHTGYLVSSKCQRYITVSKSRRGSHQCG